MADTATESLNCRHTECALAYPTRQLRQQWDRQAKHSWPGRAAGLSGGCCVTPASICTGFLSTVSPRVGSSFPSEQRGKEGGREPKKKNTFILITLADQKMRFKLQSWADCFYTCRAVCLPEFSMNDGLFASPISCFLFVLKYFSVHVYILTQIRWRIDGKFQQK